MQDVFQELYNVILDRRENPQEGSYTCYLFEKGTDKILKRWRRNRARRLSQPKTA